MENGELERSEGLKKTLCFDFGNTRLKCAIFDDALIKEIIFLDNDNDDTITGLITRYRPQKTILSSVIDHNNNLENILSASSTFIKLSHIINLPFTTPVGKPETIGADRLALSAAAIYHCLLYTSPSPRDS